MEEIIWFNNCPCKNYLGLLILYKLELTKYYNSNRNGKISIHKEKYISRSGFSPRGGGSGWWGNYLYQYPSS